MGRRTAALALVASLVTPLVSACVGSTSVGPDGDAARRDVAHDSPAEATSSETLDAASGPDGEQAPASGPMTLVTREMGLTDQRICDLDGDGREDNAIAELGLPGSQIYMAAVNMSLNQGREAEGRRSVIHFPWIDDLAGPSDPQFPAIMFIGEDVDDPLNPDDDFTGTEAFYIAVDDVDDCGEPLVVIPDLALDAGELSGETTDLLQPFPEFPIAAGARFTGRIEPAGAAGQIFICAPTSITELGAQEGLDETGGLSLLETLLAGGAPFGIPVAGLEPDLDLDGDGLERFDVDESGQIVTCIDGDSTPIEGRDCWQDARIADAFAMIAFFETVSAELAGFRPGYERRCPEPPEESIWDAR